MSGKYIDVAENVSFYHYLINAKRWRNKKKREKEKTAIEFRAVYGTATAKRMIFHLK